MSQNAMQLKPMEIGDVIDYSIEAYKSNFKILSLLALVLYIPWTFIYSFISGDIMGAQVYSFLNLFSGGFLGETITNIPPLEELQNSDTSYGVLPSFVCSALQFIYNMTIQLVFNTAIIKIIYDFVVKGNKYTAQFSSVKRIITHSFSYLPKMIGNAALYYLVFIGIYIGSFIVGSIVGMVPAFITASFVPNSIIAGGVSLFFIFIALIIVIFSLVFFWVKFVFGANAVVNEGKSVFQSVSRSFELSKGKFWHITMSSFFAAILFLILGNILLAASAFGMLVSQMLYVILYSIAQIISALLYPLMLTFITILFINMKVKKEGLDLEQKFDSLNEIQEMERVYV